MAMETQNLLAGAITNFRDFGGAASAGGGRVMRGRLFRSGQVSGLAPQALDALEAMDFALVADLRYESERNIAPSCWPTHYGERIYFHGGERTAVAPHFAPVALARIGASAVRSFYIGYYEDLPFHPLYRPLFARVLDALAETDGRALIHCTAGKDRTGTLVALILHILGVVRDDILADYLLSGGTPALRALTTARLKLQLPEVPDAEIDDMVTWLTAVQPDYIEAAFAAIRQRAGSVDAYMDGIGFDAARRADLRRRLIET